jgi:hypothetical protein
VAFVSAPDERRKARHQLKEPCRVGEVVRQTYGTRDSRCDIGDDPISPPSDLVAEVPEASDESRSDRSLQDHTASSPQTVRDRGLLDDEAALRNDDDESRVEEVTRRPSL